jgi:hypothetical protein
MSKRKTWAEKHPNAITDTQVKSAVKKKIDKLTDEVRKNPKNILTSNRLAQLKEQHRGKLNAVGTGRQI